MEIELDEETYGHVLERAIRAGRDIDAQVTYELSVNRGLCLADPGDQEAADRARIFARMRSNRPLVG